MADGEILEVLADDPAAEEDVKSLIKRTKHTILAITKEGNVLQILIQK
jgi:TusA-related sulfurtransferase